MYTTYLRKILSDLRNSGVIYTESVDMKNTTIRNIDISIQSMEEFIDDMQRKDNGITFSGIKDRCKVLQRDAERDDEIGKRTINITHPIKVNKLLDSYKSLSEKVCKYMEKSHNSVKSIEKDASDLVKDINKFDNEINMLFSTKDELTLIYCVNNFFSLVDNLESLFSKSKSSKTGNIFNSLHIIQHELGIDGEIIDAFHDSEIDYIDEENEEIVTCSYQKIRHSNPVVTGFRRVSGKLCGKTFGMMAQHVKNAK